MKPSFDMRTVVVSMLITACGALAGPGVKHVETTSMKFHGFLGTMMKMGGGNKPSTQTVYVQGEQKRTDRSDEKGELLTSNIVDLEREVFINVNHKKKEYTEMTFAEWKAMLEKMKKPESSHANEPNKAEVKVEFEAKVERTNERQTIAGFNAQKAILTMKAKGQQQASATAPGGSGAMTIVSNIWLTKEAEGQQEIIAFHRKFAEKMGMPFTEAGAQESMQALARMNPEMVKGMEKLAEEGRKLEGFAVKSETSFEAEAMQAAGGNAETQHNQEVPSSVGGLLGGLGKKMAKKPQEGNAEGKNVLFEAMTETVELKSGTLKAELFAAPAGYKKVAAKM